jgi:hypothetical protein
MEARDLTLDAISFKESPTKSQLVNTLRDIHKFLSRMGGMMLADESYAISDQPLTTMMNASVQLKAAADMFEAGPNRDGLLQAMPAPPRNPGPRSA